LNKTKIEWTDYSWNPITGCKHGCWYCYANRLTKRFKKIFPHGFEPTFYPERLKEPCELKKPSKIFVCSIADLFAKWTPVNWRDSVMHSIFHCPVKHTFQLLTKNPERIPWEWEFPDNVWVGTTVTGEPHTYDEVNISYIKRVRATFKFVSFEPLLGPIDFENYSLDGIQWVIIGKLTGSKRIKLKNSWVIDIREECDFHGIPYFEKNNLGFKEPHQKFPHL
jgi:protein gp37